MFSTSTTIPSFGMAIADYLSQYEFRVTAVADGGAMQAVLAREVVDLIVLDELRLTDVDATPASSIVTFTVVK